MVGGQTKDGVSSRLFHLETRSMLFDDFTDLGVQPSTHYRLNCAVGSGPYH